MWWMLKRRLIVALCFMDGILFRTKKFEPDVRYTVNYLCLHSADEFFCVDVGDDRNLFYQALQRISDDSQTPVIAAGRISSLVEVRHLLTRTGADAVCINTHAKNNPDLINELVHTLGSQSVTVSETGHDLAWIIEAVRRGAGQIFLHSKERDGSLQGLDIPFLKEVSRETTVPIIIGGGLGSWKHAEEAFKAGAAGVVTSNIFHFTQTALNAAKTYLQSHDIAVRV